jgi:hypothetical protein
VGTGRGIQGVGDIFVPFFIPYTSKFFPHEVEQTFAVIKMHVDRPHVRTSGDWQLNIGVHTSTHRLREGTGKS